MAKNLPAMQERQIQFLVQEDPLEKEMATHSSILAWEIPWTAEHAHILTFPRRLHSAVPELRISTAFGGDTTQLITWVIEATFESRMFTLQAEGRH